MLGGPWRPLIFLETCSTTVSAYSLDSKERSPRGGGAFRTFQLEAELKVGFGLTTPGVEILIIQLYFNPPRIRISCSFTRFPTDNTLTPRLHVTRNTHTSVPFQKKRPQAFPCFPSNFNFVWVTSQ